VKQQRNFTEFHAKTSPVASVSISIGWHYWLLTVAN